MEIFNTVSGIASILSLVISLVTLGKVSSIQNIINGDQNSKNYNNEGVSMKEVTNIGSSITQVGGNNDNQGKK